MGKDISNIQCELIGISCLEGSLYDQVRKEWEKRFQKNHAFWVDAPGGSQSANLLKLIADILANQGISSLIGRSIVLVAFLDLTKDLNTELMAQIAEIPHQLNNAFGCNVPVMLTFGNLGKMAFADKVMLRKHAAQVVDVHMNNTQTRKQLVLIANAPLVQEENDKSWKAAITLLDVLRREADPASMLPVAGADNPNDDVGFLRYGEFDHAARYRLEEDIKKLTDSLSSNGATELHAALQKELGKIDGKAKTTWDIDANMQPMHPDMVVEGWLGKNKAKKGKNSQYETARNATVMALGATGKKMQEDIIEAHASMIAEAGARLDQYILEAGVGLSLEEDRKQMHNALEITVNQTMLPSLPSFLYSENGYANEISYYLHCVRDAAVCQVKQNYVKAIREAYDRKTDEYYRAKRQDIQLRLDEAHRQLSRYMDKQTLIDKSAAGSSLPDTSFFPMLGGGAQCRFMLCREPEDEHLLTNACAGTQTSVYYIDKQYGGLSELDNASVKSLQLLMLDCSVHLDDLIK